DLAATRGTSAQPSRLHAVLQDLYQMEVLATMLDGCQGLTTKMSKEYGLPPAKPGDLLQDLVSASGERWSNATRFSAIADKYSVPAPNARVTFLTQIRLLVRNMPPKVFVDTDARTNVLDAAQGALDDAVALEEESDA